MRWTAAQMKPLATLTSLVALLALAACQSPAGAPLGDSGKPGTPLPNPPAVTEPTVTAPPAKTDTWPLAEGSIDGVRYSYRYPPGWTADLTYCVPGAKPGAEEDGHLPAGCVSTDFLVGQKALDVAQLLDNGSVRGNPGSSGKSVVTHIERDPPNVLVSRIYTVLVYESGAPVFGFSSMIGANTEAAAQDEITTMLNGVVSTLNVERSR